MTAFGSILDRFDCCPFHASAGRRPPPVLRYTPDQRARRDSTPWTAVQAVLAPMQFLAFAVSLVFVARFLLTGEGLTAATASVVVKTLFLYAIMVTGAMWEKTVFGRYLFAPMFFWEDLFSFLVIALHTAYLFALATGALAPANAMLLALVAYGAYAINATQFVLKFRAVRRDGRRDGRRSGRMVPAMVAAE